MDGLSLLARIVVYKTHRLKLDCCIALDFSQHLLTCVSSADNQKPTGTGVLLPLDSPEDLYSVAPCIVESDDYSQTADGQKAQGPVY